MDSSSSITMQILGKIHMPAIGVKIWYKFVCFSLCHAPVCRHAVRSSGTLFEQVLSCGLWVDFDSVFTFLQKGLLFQMHLRVPISITRWRHNFHQIVVNNCEKSQNQKKVKCTTSYR